jgi:hypothetical protein
MGVNLEALLSGDTGERCWHVHRHLEIDGLPINVDLRCDTVLFVHAVG